MCVMLYTHVVRKDIQIPYDTNDLDTWSHNVTVGLNQGKVGMEGGIRQHMALLPLAITGCIHSGQN